MNTNLLTKLQDRRVFTAVALVGGVFILVLIIAAATLQGRNMTPEEPDARRERIEEGSSRQPGQDGTAQLPGQRPPEGQDGTIDTGQSSQSQGTPSTRQSPYKDATIVPAPTLTFASYSLDTTIPTLPQTINTYALKTDYARTDALRLAQAIGLPAENVQERGSLVAVASRNQTAGGVLIFDTSNGFFSFISGGSHKPTNSSISPVITAQNFLEEVGVLDDTTAATTTYKRQSTPGIEYVEFHRSWQALGAPLHNALSTLNLRLDTRLANLEVGEVTEDSLFDDDVYDASDGSDGLQRPSDFNTITVAVNTQDGTVASVTSSIPAIESVTTESRQGLKSPTQAFAELKAGNSLFSLAIPSGTGYVDVTKLTPTDTAFGQTASVRDFMLTYLAANPEKSQERLEPYYLFRGSSELSGYDVDFVQVVPALVSGRPGTEVLGAYTQRRANPLLAQAQSGKSIQYGTFEIDETPPIPTPTDNPAPPPPATGSCPRFTNCYSFADGSKVCWYPSTIEETRKTGKDCIRKSKTGKLYCPATGRDFWYLPAENTTLTAEMLTVYNLLVLRGEAVRSCTPANARTCPTTGQDNAANRCYHIITGSPSLYAYSASTRRISLTVGPQGGVTYAQPAFTGGGGAWTFRTNKDGFLTFEDGSINTRAYYEYNALNVLPHVKKHHDASRAFVVERTKLEEFLTTYLFDRLELNAKEREDLIAEVRRETRTISSDRVKISLVERALLDRYLPLTLSPTPDNLYRVHVMISSATDDETMRPPRVTPIKRSGLTVVETGVMVSD